MAPTHYWSDPCGLGDPRTLAGLGDWLTLVMVATHLFFAATSRYTDGHAFRCQRIAWVRNQLFASVGDRIGQVQNFRTGVMVLTSMIGFSGFGGTAMAQMALAQKDELAKLRALIPFGFFLVAICCFGFVAMTMLFTHWLTIGSPDKLGCAEGCARESKCKVAAHEKTRRVEWDPELCSRLCSLASDGAHANSIGLQCQKLGLCFMLWPYEPWVSFVLSVVLFFVTRSTDHRFTHAMMTKWSMKQLAESEFYKPLIPVTFASFVASDAAAGATPPMGSSVRAVDVSSTLVLSGSAVTRQSPKVSHQPPAPPTVPPLAKANVLET